MPPNPVIFMVPFIAVAAVVRKERKLVERLCELGAKSPAGAQPQAAIGVKPGLAWKRLIRAAVLREGPNGSYYVDEPAWEARRRARHRRARIAATLMGIF